MKVKIEQLNIDKEFRRVFIVSDIHNHYLSYINLMIRLNLGKNDLLIIDGDVVDRGGTIAQPLQLLSEIRFEENRDYDVIMIKGNHEAWLSEAIECYKKTGKPFYMYNTLKILDKVLSKRELSGYGKWMDNLVLGIDMQVSGFNKPFKIAHASTLNLADEYESLMGSEKAFEVMAANEEYISIVGHTVTSNLRQLWDIREKGKEKTTDILEVGSLICIDCGNGYRGVTFPGKLGCLELCENGIMKKHYF